MGELELEVFRAGDYGAKGKWSEAQLDGLASQYDAALHEAPVTIDHAQTGPALGWVSGIRRNGDRLVAKLRGLNDVFLDLLKNGAFKKRSVELYTELPETGKPYLKAVSFLGAGAPAVKGLRDVLFCDPAQATQFRTELGEACSIDFAQGGEIDSRDANAPAASAAEVPEFPEVPRPDVARVDFGAIRSDLLRAGRWLPVWERQGIREFFDALAGLDALDVNAGEAKQADAWFAEFLAALPTMVPMGEAAPPSTLRASEGMIAEAENVSLGSVQLHRKVVALREARPEFSYAEALKECSRI